MHDAKIGLYQIGKGAVDLGIDLIQMADAFFAYHL